MIFPGGLDAQSFLDAHWQKRQLRMPGGAPPDLPELSADELGWLATLEDVESRLVFTDDDESASGYRVLHGPFASEELEALPQCNWTLLVQDVDKHLPAFREWFRLCAFVPDWRLDDLMISFAAPGGGVGPHVDNYDVFLVQGTGTREWRTAEPGHVEPAKRRSALALLQAFDDPDPYCATRGDVLYLPPGVPHWGIARDACTTYSIGFRAPTRADLLVALRGICGREIPKASAADRRRFYADPDLRCDEAVAGLISPLAIARARALLGDDVRCADTDIVRALGAVTTSTKEWLTPEPSTRQEAAGLAAEILGGTPASVHGMARIARCRIDAATWLFANGRGREISEAQADFVARLCRDGAVTLQPADLEPARRSDLPDVLAWLVELGAIEPGGLTSGPQA